MKGCYPDAYPTWGSLSAVTSSKKMGTGGRMGLDNFGAYVQHLCTSLGDRMKKGVKRVFLGGHKRIFSNGPRMI